VEDSFSERLRKAREAKGWTRRELARVSGVSDSYLTLLEHDKRKKPSYSIAKKISDAFDKPVGELFGDEDEIKPPPDIEKMLRDLGSALQGAVLVKIPLCGIVPGGEPLTPLDSPLEYVLVPQSLIKGTRRPFAVKLSGESLEGYGVHSGDIMVIDPDAEVLDGKIYIVLIGSETTAKKLYRENDRLRLEGSNGSTEIMSPHRVENLGKMIGHGHWTED